MWEFSYIVDTSEDPAGNYVARVTLVLGTELQCVFLKFQSVPTSEEIIEAAGKLCNLLNNPPESAAEKY